MRRSIALTTAFGIDLHKKEDTLHRLAWKRGSGPQLKISINNPSHPYLLLFAVQILDWPGSLRDFPVGSDGGPWKAPQGGSPTLDQWRPTRRQPGVCFEKFENFEPRGGGQPHPALASHTSLARRMHGLNPPWPVLSPEPSRDRKSSPNFIFGELSQSVRAIPSIHRTTSIPSPLLHCRAQVSKRPLNMERTQTSNGRLLGPPAQAPKETKRFQRPRIGQCQTLPKSTPIQS
jgi:hypothetical protein